MSLYDYRQAKQLIAADEPFYALIMAAMLKADTDNAEKLQWTFPEAHAELIERYNSRYGPGGMIESDDPTYHDRIESDDLG